MTDRDTRSPPPARRGPGHRAPLAAAIGAAIALALSLLWVTGWPAGRGYGPGAGDPSGPDSGPEEEAVPVRVEVLNGSGVAGLARIATRQLRAEGFDVVYFGNAPRFDHTRSHVLCRTGDTLAARAVAAAIGIDSVRTEIDPRLLLDVTVVLGRDWPPDRPDRNGP
jgi:hypothetical protein